MIQNALTRLFNYELEQASLVQDDFVQVEKKDEDGNVFIVYEKFDYPKFQASLGTIKDWSLNALLRAGVDPSFTIHTGLNTRLEGFGVVSDAVSVAESLVNDDLPEN